MIKDDVFAKMIENADDAHRAALIIEVMINHVEICRDTIRPECTGSESPLSEEELNDFEWGTNYILNFTSLLASKLRKYLDAEMCRARTIKLGKKAA